MNFLHVLALTALTVRAAQTQDPTPPSSSIPLTVSVFTHSVSLPTFRGFLKNPDFGLRVSTEFYYRNQLRHQLIQTLNVGFYHHRALQSGVFVGTDREIHRLYGTTHPTVDLHELLAIPRPAQLPASDYRYQFLLKQGARLLPVEVADMAYFFTQDRLTFVRTWDGRDLLMDDLTGKLNPKHFFRANRQFILHRKAIGRVHLHFKGRLKVELKPASGEDVFISRDRSGEFRTWLGE